jgi:hypothetical protein
MAAGLAGAVLANTVVGTFARLAPALDVEDHDEVPDSGALAPVAAADSVRHEARS